MECQFPSTLTKISSLQISFYCSLKCNFCSRKFKVWKALTQFSFVIFQGSTTSKSQPKILNGDSVHSQKDDAQKIIHKLQQLEAGQKKIIHLLNNLDKELSAREKRQQQNCFKHNNTTTGSVKTDLYFTFYMDVGIYLTSQFGSDAEGLAILHGLSKYREVKRT